VIDVMLFLNFFVASTLCGFDQIINFWWIPDQKHFWYFLPVGFSDTSLSQEESFIFWKLDRRKKSSAFIKTVITANDKRRYIHYSYGCCWNYYYLRAVKVSVKVKEICSFHLNLVKMLGVQALLVFVTQINGIKFTKEWIAILLKVKRLCLLRKRKEVVAACNVRHTNICQCSILQFTVLTKYWKKCSDWKILL